jgi:hypothetical protein
VEGRVGPPSRSTGKIDLDDAARDASRARAD